MLPRSYRDQKIGPQGKFRNACRDLTGVIDTHQGTFVSPPLKGLSKFGRKQLRKRIKEHKLFVETKRKKEKGYRDNRKDILQSSSFRSLSSIGNNESILNKKESKTSTFKVDPFRDHRKSLPVESNKLRNSLPLMPSKLKVKFDHI